MPGFFFLGRGTPVATDGRASDNLAMRVILLTLLFFMALGIGASCRTPGIVTIDCAPGADCDPIRDVAD